MFLYFAWKFLQVFTSCLKNCICCRELLQYFSMQHGKSENSKNISVFIKNSMLHVNVSKHIIKYYVPSQIPYRDISSIRGFWNAPIEKFQTRHMLFIRQNKKFQQSLSYFLTKKTIISEKERIKTTGGYELVSHYWDRNVFHNYKLSSKSGRSFLRTPSCLRRVHIKLVTLC